MYEAGEVNVGKNIHQPKMGSSTDATEPRWRKAPVTQIGSWLIITILLDSQHKDGELPQDTP